MTCTQAEVHRLIDLIEYELFERPPAPANVNDVYTRFKRIAESIKASSLEELRTTLGLL